MMKHVYSLNLFTQINILSTITSNLYCTLSLTTHFKMLLQNLMRVTRWIYLIMQLSHFWSTIWTVLLQDKMFLLGLTGQIVALMTTVLDITAST